MSVPRKEAMSEPARTPDGPIEADGIRSYYGRPILKEPVWKVPDVPSYLFLGGLAGASASMASVAELTGHRELVRVGRLAAAGGALASVGALIHDLGRPARFLNMLRVFKPTSPLSVGSWILAPFSGLTSASAGAQLTGVLPAAGRLAGGAAGLLGPAMCTYTAVLLSDTAVPSWHEAYPELPFLFGGSALNSAAGAALVGARPCATRPAIRMGLLGSGLELAASSRMERRLGVVGEPYQRGRAGALLTAARALTVAGAVLSVIGRRSRAASAIAGVAYLAAGACTRFGVFRAGVNSARDPRYVVAPQRDRLRGRGGG
ncbi:MAG: polysulfide reductase [Pseudonocardiaceae bacterium]|nr:polysulfide reductase [Pseudonocardiaceae bacterium]